ncbi:molybdate ABC transporter substrate-binding protein [Curtobacterium pusillum]|uniref:Molybdate ABC transporter substrate-binding protein n=1 Tax=Curtobacterium pusillum TaxID=69373 RepID=A0ABX2M9S4_9MICO|nr:molybdate ABC transporter substrate-binding protein [Curtobacterium pusillum]NUU14777.1 molybdate ABC transporter substrate-binding protein [Curtobacterium pusillum]GLK31675.1 molybdate-binding protein [Curtobacterium pusillum]
MTTHVRNAALLITVVTLAALGLAGCSTSTGSGSDTSASASGTATDGPTGKITVFAAASLQQTFTTLGDQYEAAHPGTTITFSFAGSSDLVTQIRNGAPADVFASADEANMDKIVKTDVAAGSPKDFATNVLEIAVAPGNPKKITDLDDLTSSDVQLVTCAAPVPCGAATAKVEQATGINLSPVSEEQSVTDVLGKVESGQADAGLVYVTDVQGADGKVDGVPFDASSKAVNTYPIGVLKGASNPDLAKAFTAYVRSDAGRKVLAAAGFGAP